MKKRGRKSPRKRARARKAPKGGRAAQRPRGRRGSSPARAGLRPKRKRARPSISRRVEETERAIETLGEENVRRGSIKLGETNRITPTRQGFRAVSKVIRSVNKVNRVGKERIFTYDIEGTYRGADGKIHKFQRTQVGIPRMRDIKRKKGESRAAALSRTVEQRIRRELQGILREKLGGYTLATEFKGRKLTPKEAAEQLRRLKRDREVKFKVRFRREV